MPELNGYWRDDHFTPGDGIHLGVAISIRGGGLVTPAIHAADGLTPARGLSVRVLNAIACAGKHALAKRETGTPPTTRTRT